MSKKLGKLKTFELLDTLNWEFIKEYIVLNQSLEEKDEEIKPILDCIKKDQRIAELEKENAKLKRELDINDKEHFANCLKQLREMDYKQERKSEREQVIKDLEEWLAAEVNKGFHKIAEGSYLKLESRFINSRDLQQKLNEMKGEKQ